MTMNNPTLYITMSTPFTLIKVLPPNANGEFEIERTFALREQLLFKEVSEIKEGRYFENDEPAASLMLTEVHHLGEDEEGELWWIPARFSVLDTVKIPKSEMSFFNKYHDRYSDKIQDYFKAVKEAYGIDLKRNFRPQYNDDYYLKLDLMPPSFRGKRPKSSEEGNL